MTETGYIYIPNWEHFQHYKDRRPPWIKDYVDQLNNDKYTDLPLAYRAGLQDIRRLVADVGQGRCSARADWLQKQCSWPAGWAQKIVTRLSDEGFIEVRASKALAVRKHDAPPDTEGSKEPLDKRDARASGAAMNGAVAHTKQAKKELAAAILAARSITAGDEPHLAEHTIRTEWPDLADQILATLRTSKEKADA